MRSVQHSVFWLNKKKTFYSGRCFKLINIDSKAIYNVTKDFISNKCCYFKLFKSWKKYHSFHKNVKQCNLKDHVTLTPKVIMLKIQLCHHRNKLLIKIENIFILIIFHNITVLLNFWSNKWSNKRLHSKTF